MLAKTNSFAIFFLIYFHRLLKTVEVQKCSITGFHCKCMHKHAHSANIQIDLKWKQKQQQKNYKCAVFVKPQQITARTERNELIHEFIEWRLEAKSLSAAMPTNGVKKFKLQKVPVISYTGCLMQFCIKRKKAGWLLL